MKNVEPIRDYSKILAIKGKLKKQKNPRDFLLFVMGINTALRISDLLKLKVGDVKDEQGSIKNFLYLKEEKTKKDKKVVINNGVREALEHYFNKTGAYDFGQYLFRSEKSKNNKPLTRIRAWQLVNRWCREVGIKERIGTHTLRKTAGYQMRVRGGVALEIIQGILGHSSMKITSRYIGVSNDELEKVSKNFIL
jgi:integrase